jgi:hypothetical protein
MTSCPPSFFPHSTTFLIKSYVRSPPFQFTRGRHTVNIAPYAYQSTSVDGVTNTNMYGANLRFRLQGMTSAAATVAILLLHNFTVARAAAPGVQGLKPQNPALTGGDQSPRRHPEYMIKIFIKNNLHAPIHPSCTYKKQNYLTSFNKQSRLNVCQYYWRVSPSCHTRA